MRESSKNKQNHHSVKGGEWRKKCFMRENVHDSTTTISSIKFFALLAHLSSHNVESTKKPNRKFMSVVDIKIFIVAFSSRGL